MKQKVLLGRPGTKGNHKAKGAGTQHNAAILTRAARMETLPPAGEEREKQGFHSK